MPARAALAGLLFLIVASPAARAQDRRIWVDAGAGATIAGPDVRQQFGSGWNAGLGFTIDVGPALGVRLDFLHVRVADRTTPIEDLLTGTPLAITARHFMEAGTAAVRIAAPRRGRARAYALAGAGIYYRKVTLAGPGTGRLLVCNPWWFVCRTGPADLDEIVGRRNSVDPGINVGGGVEIAVGERAAFFVEARYHYIFGPAFTDAQGVSRKANGQYLPIAAGFRF